jgi:hypothetical protein
MVLLPEENSYFSLQGSISSIIIAYRKRKNKIIRDYKTFEYHVVLFAQQK